MNEAELGAVVRALRHRRGVRQTDVAAVAGVSAGLVSLLEKGRADRLSLPAIRKIVGAVEIRLSWDVGRNSADLARLRDADHARLAEHFATRLDRLGWLVEPEVSFNHYGDRGRIDLLAYHPLTRTLLVIEIKTLIVDIQDVLGSIDIKTRVAPGPARALGWRPVSVAPMLVVVEGTTNRRRITAHERLFARFALRGRRALSWLRRPNSAPSGLLLFAKLPNRNGADARRAGRRRVRVAGARTSVGASRGGPPTPSSAA